MENCGFAPKTTKNIVFFDEKRSQRDPKLCATSATRRAVMGIHLGTIGLSREEREEREKREEREEREGGGGGKG